MGVAWVGLVGVWFGYMLAMYIPPESFKPIIRALMGVRLLVCSGCDFTPKWSITLLTSPHQPRIRVLQVRLEKAP